jgi:hypothetical protein
LGLFDSLQCILFTKTTTFAIQFLQMAEVSHFPTGFPMGRGFGLLMKLYFGALTKKLEQLDIDRHYSILILLESCDGNCSQQYISNLLQIDKASMVRIIDYLVKKGCIKRGINPKSTACV